MNTIVIVWVLVAAPYPWAERQIPHSVYKTQAECMHQAVTEGIETKKQHDGWEWECRPARARRWLVPRITEERYYLGK
jgi:hypothetical protein